MEEALAESSHLNGTLCDLGISRYMYLRAKENDQAMVKSWKGVLGRAYSNLVESGSRWRILLWQMKEACHGIVMEEGRSVVRAEVE